MTNEKPDNRLVLHILRAPDPTSCDSSQYNYKLLLLSIAWQ